MSWSYVEWCKFCITSEVWTSAILEWLRLQHKNYGVEVTFNGMTTVLNFIKIFQFVQKVIGGGGAEQTAW
jgi:hypothetical protein